MSPEPPWTATISVRLDEPEIAEWLARALAPEAAREVPRATASVDRPEPTVVRISLEARDSGAARAALNTYLGWVHLTLETVRAARASRARAESVLSGGPADPPPGSNAADSRRPNGPTPP